MKSNVFAVAFASLLGLAYSCTPDMRPFEISKLKTVREAGSNVTTLSFDAKRSGDTTATPLSCTRREDPEVNNDTFFSSCSKSDFQWIAGNYEAGSPPGFEIFLQLRIVCPPSPQEQSWSWRSPNVKPSLKCETQANGKEVCTQATKQVVLASWD